MLVAGVVAYRPTLTELWHIWRQDPDYSHGFLVVPLAACFLWLRRATFPGMRDVAPTPAICLLLVSVAMRYIACRFYYPSLEGWSVVPWAAAVAALMGGKRLLWWSSPSLCFLVFMTPLPYSWEAQLAYPLQKITSIVGAWTLQLLGQPAFAADTTILLGSHQMEVAPACCGIRLFMSTFALAFTLAVIGARAWWETVCLAAAAAPIALAANAMRIALLGLSYNDAMTIPLRSYLHDFAGMSTMFVAACLLWLLHWYLKHIFRKEDVYDAAALIREAGLESR